MRFPAVFVSIIVSMLIAMLILSGCAAVQQRALVQMPAMPVLERVSQAHIPYPILLLHGLGQKASVWDAQAVRFYEQEGLVFGGTLRASTNSGASSNTSSGAGSGAGSKVGTNANAAAGKTYYCDTKMTTKTTTKQTSQQMSGGGDFFTVAFANPTDSVGAWKADLDNYVRIVRERTRAEKVLLIGYSMGGLTARYYLTQHPNDHHVQRLITIGSPHQGSPFAKIWRWKTSLVRAQQNANPVLAALLKPAVDGLASLEKDMAFDAPAVRDLMRPEDGGEFTKRTGALPHPNDVEYVSVVGKVEVLKELQTLSKSGVQEIVRRGLEAIGFGMEAAFADGDGVVSARSQTMTELPWFQADRSRQRIAQTITLNTVHEDHLRQSTEIQRVSLEAKPEFKGAEFYTIENPAANLSNLSNKTARRAALVLEFTDYLPPQLCSIVVRLGAPYALTLTAQKSDIALVRKSNGSVVAQVVVPLPEVVDFANTVEATFTITNTFGNSCSASKVWTAR
jgi:pimeloyl-ACP methyl ester carboxylesterase